ncbi:MAG: dimethyl sulfoxide reductase anchor subunit, partial [Verrucomicrobiales bacterium]|nr:dimethyl sulfoxide reductase anchor subunit [Verrucomicrobiales bacterium]
MSLPHEVPPPPPPQDGLETLVDALIAEQRRLTAVERFSQRHRPDAPHALEPHYRDLIPLSLPRPGEQYAFEVDLDRCSGCKGCVTACHSLNGLEDGETWRRVGFLVGEQLVPAGPEPAPGIGFGAARFNRVIPLQQTVTTACHHCADPACLNGCPVLAYDKDPRTGIVRHLDDQCIGCSYCILKCPYEVPQFSKRLGIVRKCDLCHDRLAQGEAPACVQACPNEAIRITTVSPRETSMKFRESIPPEPWLPDAPDPRISLPTTRYRTRLAGAPLRSADHGLLRVAPLHGPLVVMLVLTQAGLGGLVAATGLSDSTSAVLAGLGAAAILFAGLAASTLHLGQPRKAWRIWMGWRTSWLSREALILGAAAALAGVTVAWWATRLPSLPPGLESAMGWLRPILDLVHRPTLQGLWIGTTLATLGAQAMVYADTGRACWSLRFTAPRFAGTPLLLGVATVWMLQPSPLIGLLLAVVTLVKLAFEIAPLKYAESDSEVWTALRRSAAL